MSFQVSKHKRSTRFSWFILSFLLAVDHQADLTIICNGACRQKRGILMCGIFSMRYSWFLSSGLNRRWLNASNLGQHDYAQKNVCHIRVVVWLSIYFIATSSRKRNNWPCLGPQCMIIVFGVRSEGRLELRKGKFQRCRMENPWAVWLAKVCRKKCGVLAR